VHCDSSDWVKRAKEVLDQSGAQEIGSANEKPGDFANADKPLPRVRSAAGGTTVAEEEYPARTETYPVRTETVRTETVRADPARTLRRRTDTPELDDAE
jgi:hypothetical protein